MKLLQSLLTLNVGTLTESADVQSAVEQWMDKNRIHSFEGDSGVRSLCRLLAAIGYSSLEYFLADNSGSLEEVLQWLGHQNNPDWAENLSGDSGDAMSDALEQWQSSNNAYHFEGNRGVRSFDQLVRAIGYRGLDNFLADNPGAVEAILTWIGEQDNEEWTEALGGEVDEAKKAKDADEVTDDPDADLEGGDPTDGDEGDPEGGKKPKADDGEEDPLLAIATKIFGIADWDEESHQDASGKKLQKALKAAFDAGVASTEEGSEGKTPKKKISENIEDDQSEQMDRFHNLVYAKMASVEQQLRMKQLVDAFADAYDEDDEDGENSGEFVDAMEELNDEIQGDHPAPAEAPYSFGYSYEFPKEGALDEGAITTGLKIKVSDLHSNADEYFHDLTPKAAQHLLDEWADNQSELTIEAVSLKNGIITVVPHFGDTIDPKDHGRIIANLEDELSSFAMEYIENESRHIVGQVAAQLKHARIKTTFAEVDAWLVGGGRFNPRFFDQIESQLGYDHDAGGWEDNATFWRKIGVTQDQFSILVAASL